MQPKPPLGPVGRLLLGLAIVAGAAGLAWLASPSTMTLTRTSAKTVTVEVETRLFNRFRIGGFRIDGAESVEVVGNFIPSTGTGPEFPGAVSVYFVTRDGRINYGLRQKLFDDHVSEIREFFASDAPRVAFSVNDPSTRLGSFIIVSVAVIVMSLLGAAVAWSGVTGPKRS